ncbi:MAG: D-tyrosyl-tRNA(Tyr) deacylase [Candidatus Azotimanducaceae bacterium]|jgi:D-tyrosyl-tRNA(Tyr) deacylase
MRGLIQRVSEASVVVEGMTVGKVGRGMLLLLGIQKGDDHAQLDKLLDKVLAYRIFPDDAGHMNLSLTDIVGDLLIVSQFTLAADTKKGLRPSFSSAAAPDVAEEIYDEFVLRANIRCTEHKCAKVQTGLFGADMKVALLNDGPVTFLLET